MSSNYFRFGGSFAIGADGRSWEMHKPSMIAEVVPLDKVTKYQWPLHLINDDLSMQDGFPPPREIAQRERAKKDSELPKAASIEERDGRETMTMKK